MILKSAKICRCLTVLQSTRNGCINENGFKDHNNKDDWKAEKVVLFKSATLTWNMQAAT